MAQIKLFRGQNTSLSNVPITDGAVYVIANESNTGDVYADVGQQRIRIGSGESNIQIKTTQEWRDETPKTVSQEGVFYIFVETDSEDKFTSTRVKIGDGKAYVVDLPFIDQNRLEITQNQIDHWNHKLDLATEVINDEKLVFTRSMNLIITGE